MPREYRVAKFGGIPFRGTIYSERSLRNQNGLAPESVVGRQLSETMEDNGLDHVIRYDFDPIPDEAVPGSSVCGEPGARDFWIGILNTGTVQTEPDANLLLMNQGGGGCGGGRAATAPAENIDHDPGVRVRSGRDDWARNVSAAMHEVGHCLGFGHNPHPGFGWNDDTRGEWHRTPNNSANGVENLCGIPIPVRRWDQTVSELWYNPCAFQHMKLTEKEPLVECTGDSSCPDHYRCEDGQCVIDPPTVCEQEVNTIPDVNFGTCYNITEGMDCPDGPLTYTARTICELQHLEGLGWTPSSASVCEESYYDALAGARPKLNCEESDVALKCPDGDMVVTPQDKCVEDELLALGWSIDSSACSPGDCPSGKECVNGKCVDSSPGDDGGSSAAALAAGVGVLLAVTSIRKP